MAKIGNVIDGKYEILKEVGRGGMSVVYLAMDNRLNKQWAIKEIKKKGTNSENQIVVQSLLSEANLMKRLDHPNLPRIVDIIENGQTIYIVMDYIEGEPLDKILKRKGAQPEEAVIEWGIQLAEVLDYLHTRQPAIIYRDMKPANVMLRPDGSIKLYDFGIAREYKEQNSSDTVSLGTKGYAAPEQFGGMGQTDARTDVYGLGVTLYHLVTGKNPCEPPYEILPIRDVNPSLSSGLEYVIKRCTQLNPEERFQSCLEVLFALNHLDEIGEPHRKRQKSKLNKFIVSVACTLVMTLAGTGTLIGYNITLRQQADKMIAMYGAESAGGGNLKKLEEAIDEYGNALPETAEYELVDNYIQVCRKNMEEQYKEYSTKELSDEQKKEYKDNEKEEIYTPLQDIVNNNVVNLEQENQNDLCYKAGNIMLSYYNMWDGIDNDEAIIDRYDEAARLYKKIKGTLKSGDKDFAKRIVSMIEARDSINDLSSETPDGVVIEKDEVQKQQVLEKAWEQMVKDVANEKNDSNKVNLYMLMSSVVYDKRTDFELLEDDKKQEIITYSGETVNVLNQIKANNTFSEQTKEIMEKKVDKSIIKFQKIQEYLTSRKGN